MDDQETREFAQFSLDTITKLKPEHAGHVVVAASHGGVYAGYCAAKGNVRAVILNDAGVGRDQAGIGSLAYLDRLGIAAATVDANSSRIGDAGDMLASGRISHVNRTAGNLGCAPGQTVHECARSMRSCAWSSTRVPPAAEARFVSRGDALSPPVVVMDSLSLIEPDDAGAIVVTGSHGGLLGGDPATPLGAAALAAIFSDAGLGKDSAGISRLSNLDRQHIPGAAVSSASARIGDGMSIYADGVISHVNEEAAALEIRVGDNVRTFIEKVRAAKAAVRRWE